jgi:tRNA pseudouridine55 synthase
VSSFDVEATGRPDVFAVTVTCSSGTYVRVLADDLGRLLGGGAHLQTLRRTAVGEFTVEMARPVDQLDPTAVLSPAQALGHLDAVPVDDEVARLIGRGLPLDRVPLGATGDGPWALVDARGQLLAVYEATGTDRVRAAVVLVTDSGAPVGTDGETE